MATTLTLYIDSARGELVTSATDSTQASLPQFIQGDTLDLKIYLLNPIGGTFAGYSKIAVTDKTLNIALGTRVGNSSTYYTQQFTWDTSTDLADPYFTGTFTLNTTEVTTLIGSAASATCFFEVKVVEGGIPTTVLCKPATIYAAVIKPGSPTAIPNQTAISAEQALATFLQHAINGPITFTVGAYSVLLTVDADGFHANPIA